MKITNCIILILLAVSFQGCMKRQPYLEHPVSDVEKTNVVRKELGIREIKDDWEFYTHQFNTDIWKLNDSICKTVALSDDSVKILWEEDIYCSGRTWTDYHGKQSEYMGLIYHYSDKAFYIYYTGNNPDLKALIDKLEGVNWGIPGHYGYKAETNEKTMETADKILSTLGLKRL